MTQAYQMPWYCRMLKRSSPQCDQCGSTERPTLLLRLPFGLGVRRNVRMCSECIETELTEWREKAQDKHQDSLYSRLIATPWKVHK